MAGRVERWSGRSLFTAWTLVLTLPLLHEGPSISIFSESPEGCSALIDCDQTEDFELIASDPRTNDYFGHSVSVSGLAAVVGAYRDNCAAGFDCGSAYVYGFDGSSWVEEARLTASDAAADDHFGFSVSVSGLVAVVGADENDCAAGSNCGSAYVYRFDGSSWEEEAKITASDAWANDFFGGSVAVSGDTVVVGAHGDFCAAGGHCGSAYVYHFDGSSWVEEVKLTASDAAPGDRFGYSVSVSGYTAVVGAYEDHCAAGEYGCGAAYVYRFDGSSWVEQAKLTASDAEAGGYFGVSVSVSGDTAVVGAYLDDCAPGYGCGSAYVYRFDGSNWVEEAKLTASDAAEYDGFGLSVSVSGLAVVVGAYRSACAAGDDCGSAYVYRFDGASWVEEARLSVSDAAAADRFGVSVSVSGDTAVVGAQWGGCPARPDCGSAYVLDLRGDDCNCNAIADECEMSDCNENCIDDAEDIANLTSPDCKANGIPDECEIDKDSTAPGGPFFCDPAAPPAGLAWCDGDCNTDGVPDECGLLDSDCNRNCIDDAEDITSLTSPDCNSNGIPDECEIDKDTTAPGGPFFCNPAAPPAGLAWCDRDCNIDGVPDECGLLDSDCNRNCIEDADDILNQTSSDCNDNDIPDECDMETGFIWDCNNSNGIPDLCETYRWPEQGAWFYVLTPLYARDTFPVKVSAATVNSDSCYEICEASVQQVGDSEYHIDVHVRDLHGKPGVGEVCLQYVRTELVQLDLGNLAAGDYVVTATEHMSPWTVDCTESTVTDEVQGSFRVTSDCNENQVYDACDVADGTESDCNDSGIPDVCEIDKNSAAPGGPFFCDPAAPPAGLESCDDDCNESGVPDQCEMSDCNGNGIGDECEGYVFNVPPPDPGGAGKNRYVLLNLTENTFAMALRMTFVDLPGAYAAYNGMQMWVGPPVEVTENAGKTDPAEAPGFPTFWAAPLQCNSYYTDWSAFPVVYVYDEVIVPDGVYDIQAIAATCDEAFQGSYSAPLTVTQSRWGDVVSDCATAPCGPPDGVINVTTDVTAILNKFKNLIGAPIKARSDLDLSLPDQKINISDVTYCLEAFGSFPYPFEPGPPPPPCP